MSRVQKRTYRNDMSPEQKAKISQTLKAKNMQRSLETRKKISDGLKNYWDSLPQKPVNNNTETKITDLI